MQLFRNRFFDVILSRPSGESWDLGQPNSRNDGEKCRTPGEHSQVFTGSSVRPFERKMEAPENFLNG